MPIVVLTGPVRSGKSAVAADLAASSGRDVVVAVAGRGEGDPEMARRITRHRHDRPREWTTMEVAGRLVGEWVAEVPAEACLVVDCLGTLISDTVFTQMDL
ncbi:MAG: bifunctional adenosylcobinamide kinase/adenosylcobinamide-phosphate guanylyltransferase, partial [Coriobacteriales bacterium]